MIGKLKPTDYWQKIAKKLDTTYKSARYGNCTYALILDKRHPKKKRVKTTNRTEGGSEVIIPIIEPFKGFLTR